jgi:hypothetical protein
LKKHGRLTGPLIASQPDLACTHTYRNRFGTLIRAYAMVGYSPHFNFAYIEANRRLRPLQSMFVLEIVTRLQQAGATVVRDPRTDVLTINGEFTARVVALRSTRYIRGALRWDLRPSASMKSDLTVAIRLAEDNETPIDYYLLPASVTAGSCCELRERNGLPLDAYRYDSLDYLYQMAARRPLRRNTFAAPPALAK